MTMTQTKGRELIQFTTSGERQIVDHDSMTASDFLHHSEADQILANPALMLDWNLDNDISRADLEYPDGTATYRSLA
jgi:hypothetical protein